MTALAKTNAERQAEWRARQGAKKRELEPCGTVAAARRHRRAKEDLCEPCDQAVRERNAENYQKRKCRP